MVESTLDTLLDGSFFGTALDCLKPLDERELPPKSALEAVPRSCCSSLLCPLSLACCRTIGNNDNTGSRGQKRHRHNHHLQHHQHHHQQQLQQQQLELDADTIVIGNGPAGIALSALLSGWRPFYNRRVPHPDPHLHAQLTRMASSSGDDNYNDLSLLDQDLDALADEHFERAQNAGGAGGHTPFSVLYDCLARPHLTAAAFASAASHAPAAAVAGHHAAAEGDADAEQFVVDGTSAGGEDCGQRHRSPSPSSASPSSSCLCWRRRERDAISHIVLGDQQIGGSWTEYDDHVREQDREALWMDN